MIRVLSVFGTRPEAIKMAPVVRELESRRDVVESRICVTAQHRQMLDQVNHLFGIQPDIDLNVMVEDQTLGELSSAILAAITGTLESERPDVVLVQGDTTTVFITALAAFYLRIPVGHVEAGLRTQDRYDPFPEEINRRLVGSLATYHFAPTEAASDALLSEGVPPESITVTGNTVVDALHQMLRQPVSAEATQLLNRLGFRSSETVGELEGPRLLLVTAHRRESWGAPLEAMCRGLLQLVERNPNAVLVYPVHLNPQVQRVARSILSGHDRIHLVDPVSYEPFVRLMDAAYFILTDSGGIQEEACSLGKPVLVLRDKTERWEIVEAGGAELVGADEARIVGEGERLLNDTKRYREMAKSRELFGDGHAAERIVDALLGAERAS